MWMSKTSSFVCGETIKFTPADFESSASALSANVAQVSKVIEGFGSCPPKVSKAIATNKFNGNLFQRAYDEPADFDRPFRTFLNDVCFPA